MPDPVIEYPLIKVDCHSEKVKKFTTRQMETTKLAIRAALFDTKSAVELSKQISNNSLWTFKLVTTTFYISLFGGLRPAQLRGHQFYLENMHLLPSTKQGWFHYHKQKNLVVLKEFIQKGSLNGLKYSLVTLFYSTLDNWIGDFRGKQDFVNSTASAFVTSMIWASKVTKRQRIMVLGLGSSTGLAVGLLEDLYQHLYKKSIKEFY